MKKNNLLIIGIVFLTISCLIMVGCTESNDGKDQSVGETNEVDQHNSTYAQSKSLYESIDDLIKDSVIIVNGKVKESTAFDGATTEYIFKIDQQLKGKSDSKVINVYQSNHWLEEDEEYVLFLTRWEGGLYPAPVHTSINRDNIIAIENDKVISTFKFLEKNMHKEELFQMINDSPYIEKTPSYMGEEDEQRKIAKDSATLEELISSSDIIARIVPTYIRLENKYFKDIEVKELEILGHHDNDSVDDQLSLEEVTTLYVPPSVEVDEEYIVFLKYYDGMYQVTTKEGSVIHKKDTEKWEKVMEALNK